MNKKHIVIAAILSIIFPLIVGCQFIPPQCTLRLYGEPSFADNGSGYIRISFRLTNSGSVALQNCKVKWYVDDQATGVAGSIEYDEITTWVPSFGVSLGIGEISSVLTVDTTSVMFADGVEYYGVYAWGWENPPDEYE